MILWNNNDVSNPEMEDKRTPLMLAILKDQGQVWQKLNDMESNPDGCFCYIAIAFFEEKTILLDYCSGSQSNNTGLS